MNTRKKVLLFGTFDVLHKGHEFVIKHALAIGNVFITLALDETIQKIKGQPPMYTYELREKCLKTKFPTVTIIKGDPTNYTTSLRLVQPDIIVLGYDQKLPPNVTDADFTVPVMRLPAFKPDQYKSSIVKQKMSKKHFKKVCVFCGSRTGKNPAFTQAALKTGTWIAMHNYTLIYGGSNAGLMGIVAQEVLAKHGTVIGVQPTFLKNTEGQSLHISEYIETNSMSTRKDAMIQAADIFIVLPGGIGTLDELSEILCLYSIMQIAKPIIVVNVANFFTPLFIALDSFVKEGFMNQSVIDSIIQITSIDELSDLET